MSWWPHSTTAKQLIWFDEQTFATETWPNWATGRHFYSEHLYTFIPTYTHVFGSFRSAEKNCRASTGVRRAITWLRLKLSHTIRPFELLRLSCNAASRAKVAWVGQVSTYVIAPKPARNNPWAQAVVVSYGGIFVYYRNTYSDQGNQGDLSFHYQSINYFKSVKLLD